MKVGVLMTSLPLSVLQPLITDQVTLGLRNILREIQLCSGHKVLLIRKGSTRSGPDCPPTAATDTGPTLRARINRSEVRKLVHCWGQDLWQQRWDSSSQCSQTKIWLPIIRTDTPWYFRNLPRNDLGMALQLLTGHNGMKRHSSKTGGDRDDVDCRLCGDEEEDAVHFWARCPAIQHLGWTAPHSTGDVALFINFNNSITPQFRTGDRPIAWTCSQLSRFLRVPFIAELLMPEWEHQT